MPKTITMLDPASLQAEDYVRTATRVYEVVSNEVVGTFPSSRRRLLTARDISSEEVKIFTETEAKQLHKRGAKGWLGPHEEMALTT